MSFSEDIPIDGYEEDPYSGCRSLSPLPSELTITSNDQRWLKGGKQTQSNQNNMSSLFNKFIQKDKEAESLRKENQELRDKLKEFEYLIIKGSEEVKRKQSEISSLNSIIDTLKQTMPHAASIDHLQRQLDEAQRELTQTRSEAAQTQTKLRVEVQREKEMNLSLSKQVAEMKSRLDIVLQESKGNFDDLQKNFSMTSGKYMQIEKEYNDAKQLLKELTTDNEIKNQTLDQAHEVISKLKQEIENLVEDNQGLHMKVKEYKGKCKTLKKQNASAKDQMREFDNKMKEFEELQNELSQAREDHKSLMRARIEDRLKVDDKRINQSQENETLRGNLSELKEQLSKFEQENSDLQSKLSELKVKYDETLSALKEKEKEFDKLHDFVKKEEERNRHELQAFKTQTLRSFHALTQGGQEMLPPLHSRQASPLKNFTRSRKQSSEMNDVSLATTAIRKGGEEGQPSRRSSILRKTTPIKLYNSKNPDGFEHRSQYQEMSDVNTLSMLTYTSPADDKQDIKKEPARISGFDEVREIEVDKLSMYKEEVKEDEQKNNLTVACLSEELQYSLERENYLSLLIETLYTKAEFEVKRHIKKLEEKSQENPEVEEWNTKGEELEQKHNEILEKYASTADIIMELTKNNKVLSEKLDTVVKEYNLINKKYKDLLKHSNEEQVAYQKLNKGLLEDTKSFMNTFNRLKSLSQGIHPGAIERIIDDYEVYQNELKNIEDFIDGLQVPENTQNLQSLLKETKKKIAQEASQGEHFAKTKGSEMSLLSKISRKIELYENKLRQMQEERAELNTKLNDLKGDIKNWKEAADAIEKDYQASIRDKDESLKNTESVLKRTEALLAEQEYLSNKQSERLNEFAGRDMSASLILQEKESFIKDLLNQKHELCERLDEINQFSANMKREMTEKMKELSYKNDALSELEGELMQKDQELNMKDMKIEEKIEQIFDLEQIILTKDREILQLRNDNIDLQSQVFGLKEEKTRIEYAYNLAQSRGTPSRDMRMSVSSTKTLEERPEKREGSRAGSARRKERPSVPNLKKEDYQPRMSCGSQSEKYNLTEKENSMKQLKKENAQLAKENDQLFHKLNKLNELIVSNKALEEEVGVLRAAQMSRGNQFDNFTRSPLKEAGRRTVSGTFDANFLEKCLQLPDEPQQEKDALKQLKENIKDTASIQYVEKYKAKTKKVFQKRVKELEILLKFLDHKVRGCKFENSSYIVCSINRDPPSVEEGKALVRMNYLVENMLEKNTNLKNFVGELVKKIETIYIKNHNLTVILGKLLQNMFMSCAQNQKDLSPSQMQLQSELGGLSQCTIPEVVVDYEQIETKVQNGGGSFSQQFFSLFARLEPKIHTLSKILLQNLTHHNVPKTSAPVSSIKDEDYLNSKVQKIREVENLYSKLTEIIHRNNDMNLSLPDYAHDYIQTYNHIYGAVINEVYSIMNFTSNLLSGNKLTSEDDLQSYNITYETEQANATAKLNSMNDSSKDLEGRFRLAGKKKTEDSYTFQMNQPSSVLHDQRVNSIESPSPKKESLQLQSKSSPYTPPKFDENQKYGFIDSQFDNSRRRGKTQRSSVKTNDERENKWMQTSRY